MPAILTHEQTRRLADFVERLEELTATTGVEIAYYDRTMLAIDGDPAVYLAARREPIDDQTDGERVTYVVDTRDA